MMQRKTYTLSEKAVKILEDLAKKEMEAVNV